MFADDLVNPFYIVNYNNSWKEIQEQVKEIIHRFPNRYKMAYHDEDEQKIIVFTSLDFRVFGKDKSIIIFISKIDTSENSCLIAYEAKKIKGDVETEEEFQQGKYFIETFQEDMFLVC